MPSIDYKCKCGAVLSFSPKEVGELRRCDKCLSSFMVPFASSPDANIVPGEELTDGIEVPNRRNRAVLTENVPVEFGDSFPLAYDPSGAPGDLARLILGGVTAVGGGVAAGGACVGAALGIDYAHNAVPYFFFVVPIVVLAILTMAPAVFGWVTGTILNRSIEEAKCRYPAVVGLVALLWASGAVAVLMVAAQFAMPEGRYFLEDVFVPFVRKLVTHSAMFTYVENPDLVAVPSWAIYSILAASGILGLYSTYGKAVARIDALPFCEACNRYMTKNTLWRISPVHALKTVAAFMSLDYKGIEELPYCDFPENYIELEVWGCLCRREYILELTGHAMIPAEELDDLPEKRKPVRIYSRTITLKELNRIRECGVTA